MTSEEKKRAIVTISKEDLAEKPAAEFKGEIVLIDSPDKVHEAVEDLRKAEIIGFDTETRPCFRKGQAYEVALIQLSTPEKCYLFRTNIIGFPKELIAILEDPNLFKVGLSLHDDFHQIRRVTDVEPQSFLDLQNYVREFKIADISLSKIYSILFGERISKGQRLTNWEATELTGPQQHYAALDAYSCIKIYRYLKSGLFNPFDSPYLTVPPLPQETEEKQ